MKKTFLARRNAVLSSADVSWGAFALAFALLVLLLRFLAPNAFLTVFSPVLQGAGALSAGSHAFFSSFGDRAALTLRNEQLVRENSALALENRALVEKSASLGALRESSVLGATASGIIAGVIARPPASPYDTLVLSAGSNEGVELGMEVFGEGGVPLGIVSSVLADFSRVTAFSAPEMTVDGWIGRAHTPITLTGAGGGALRASAARSLGIVVGDAVFAPGPGLLPIGTVVRVDSDPSSPAVTLHIQLVQNIFSVSWLELRATGPAFAAALSWMPTTP